VTFAAKAMLAFIRGYQLTFSAIMGRQCRFYPSCSHYAAEAIRRYGALRGAGMGLRRILRCHPWNPGGYDPVPAPGFRPDFLSENACNCATDAFRTQEGGVPHPPDAQGDTARISN
jgi:uncharacterized protein